VYLTGVGARASGAEAYLAAEAGVPVSPLPAPRLEAITPAQAEALPGLSRALGLALGLRSRPRDLDLRRGALSYQRGYAFIKERAPVLAALGGTILLSFFFSTWAELRALAHEHESLATELAALSKTVLGEEALDAERARELLDAARAKVETDPMPHADGFDVMIQLAKAVPTAIVHDVEELDLAREKVKIRGIVGSAGEAQQVADGMKQYPCLTDVKISKVTQVVNGSRQKYVLEGDLKCPQDAAGSGAKKKPEGEESEKRP
jgi:general secretion pathway protein L